MARSADLAASRRWIRPSTIAAGYGIIAGLWILGSGLLLDSMIGRDGGVRSVLEQAKGFAFVGVTSTILWLVLRRFAHSMEAMAANSARLAQFPQLSPNPVLELGPDGSVVSVNLAASLAAHQSGRAIVEFLPAEYATITRDCIASGEARPQVPVSRYGRFWEWTFFPVGGPSGAYAFGIERTEHEQLQAQVQQAARMESVGRMAAGLAHDLNNILTAIGGYASLATMDSAPGVTATEELDGIQTEVQRASLLVKRLLSISRMRAPGSEMKRVEVARAVEQLSGTMRQLVPTRVTLRIDSPEHLAVVEVDASELEQALLNLITNAVDAIDEAGEITISTSVSDGSVSLAVRDTGSGIEPGIMARIFDPFFTTKDEGKGTGLGLASVSAFARRSGGKVEVESVLGRGTVISLRLPLAAPVSA